MSRLSPMAPSAADIENRPTPSQKPVRYTGITSRTTSPAASATMPGRTVMRRRLFAGVGDSTGTASRSRVTTSDTTGFLRTEQALGPEEQDGDHHDVGRDER